jgi:hypothetical protein
MMRWVFALLVLANLGLLMWASWHRAPAPGTLPPRPVFHPELMVPLNTPGVALRSRRNEKAEAPLVVAKPRLRCVTLGPFATEAADKAVARLTVEGFETRRTNQERQVESSYWIHLAPYATRKEAERRLKELEKLGLRDILIMQDTQGAIAISLGLFQQPDNARHRLEELAQKGIEAKQEIRYRSESVSQLELRLPEPADETLARLRALDWGAGVELVDAACPVEPGG